MTLHSLKLNDQYFHAVKNGVKTFEVRKNDRDYKVGDTLRLTLYKDGENMQISIERYVSYILTHEDFPDGVPEGYIIMGIKECGE